jgi:hypothetical protein
MNRIIIIGNGFDLSNGLETSYGHFIRSYIFEVLQNFTAKRINDQELIQFSSSGDRTSINYGTWDVPDGYHNKGKAIELIDLIKKKDSHFRHLTVKLSPFFERIYDNLTAGWVDIEQEYYNFLLSLFNANDTNGIIHLNKDFEQLKSKLKEYLKTQQEKYNNSPFPANKSIAFQEDSKSVSPKEVCILNFNYTEPRFYDTEFDTNNESDNKNYHVINIHGNLNEELIFGYGDEETEDYRKMVEDGNDNIIANFKTQHYSNSNKYTQLDNFLKKDLFQVYIVGHSCGKSDRTVLKHIFEHENCHNIKIFYFQKTETDNNFQVIYNSISRIISKPSRTRSIVTPRPDCESINNIIRIAAEPQSLKNKAQTANN